MLIARHSGVRESALYQVSMFANTSPTNAVRLRIFSQTEACARATPKINLPNPRVLRSSADINLNQSFQMRLLAQISRISLHTFLVSNYSSYIVKGEQFTVKEGRTI